MWKLSKKIAQFETPWISLIGESYIKEGNEKIDYWRTESSDSVIAITTQSGNFVFPKKQFRPGVGQYTLDFPGGRCSETMDQMQVMNLTIQRELEVKAHNIQKLTPLGYQGYAS